MQTRIKHIIRALFFAALLNPILAIYAQPQNACEALLKEAADKYTDGRFDEAIVLLDRCLKQDRISTDDEMAAQKLLGKIYLAKEDNQQAKAAFWKMLELNPKINLSSTDDTDEVRQFFDRVKSEFIREQQQRRTEIPPSKSGGSKKKLLIGSAAVATAVAAAIIFWPDGDEGFPKPPARP